METDSQTFQELLEIVRLGALVGLFFGFIPGVVGAGKGNLAGAFLSLVGCVAAGVALGVIGALPAAIVATYLVARQEPAEEISFQPTSWVSLFAAAAAATHVFVFIATVLLVAAILVVVRAVSPGPEIRLPVTIGLGTFAVIGGAVVALTTGKWVRRRLARASLVAAVIWLCVLLASTILLLNPFLYALF